MRNGVRVVALTSALWLAASSCGDSTGPGASFGQTDRTALAQALLSTGALTGSPLAGFASFAVAGVDKIGSMSGGTSAAVTAAVNDAILASISGIAANSYEGAVGFAIGFDVNIAGSRGLGWFTGVIGWNGLTAAGKVTNMVIVGGGDDDTGTPPTSASGSVGEDGSVEAFYYDGTNQFYGTSGSGTITGSSFGSGKDCSATSQGISVTCNYSQGTMDGNFQFEAIRSVGTGTYSQPKVNFTKLPAVRVLISVK